MDRDDRDVPIPPEDADIIESDRVRRDDDANIARTPANEPNPPRTTRHGITSPKFGSAGSGGAELEPGPERD